MAQTTCPSDLLTMPASLWPDRSIVPDAHAPDMLYAIADTGVKSCRLCGRMFDHQSQGYHSHAAKHIREGHAQPVQTRRYRRWYQLTGAGRIHYASRED